MTAQINDLFRFQEHEYAIAGISEGELFDPAVLNLNPVGTCTACWRGYQATFAISESHLVLDTLDVSLMMSGEGYQRQEGPVINGVKPSGQNGEYDWFNNHYEGLGYRLEYSGGLLLAQGFIRELYVHMGFHPAWKYETVLELIFDKGVLTQEFDRSQRMAEIRNMALTLDAGHDPGQKLDRDDIARFVTQAFDRSYCM